MADRITQTGIEVGKIYSPTARMTQQITLVATSANPNARFTQNSIEAGIVYSPTARMTQQVILVLVPSASIRRRIGSMSFD